MKKNSKTKTLNKTAMLKNICGLSIGDRAYCGPYGVVTCIKAGNGNPVIRENKHGEYVAITNRSRNYRGMWNSYTRNSRKFSVSGSTKLQNRGNWTMKQLREAICA